GRLAPHPRRVHRALVVLDVLGDAEPEVLQVRHRARHVRGDLVEVVQPHQRTRRVQVVPPGEPLDVLDVVEELVREAQRVLDTYRVADASDPALLATLDAAAEFGEPGDGLVQVLDRKRTRLTSSPGKISY